jgi:hypothetical protein
MYVCMYACICSTGVCVFEDGAHAWTGAYVCMHVCMYACMCSTGLCAFEDDAHALSGLLPSFTPVPSGPCT